MLRNWYFTYLAKLMRRHCPRVIHNHASGPFAPQQLKAERSEVRGARQEGKGQRGVFLYPTPPADHAQGPTVFFQT